MGNWQTSLLPVALRKVHFLKRPGRCNVEEQNHGHSHRQTFHPTRLFVPHFTCQVLTNIYSDDRIDRKIASYRNYTARLPLISVKEALKNTTNRVTTVKTISICELHLALGPSMPLLLFFQRAESFVSYCLAFSVSFWSFCCKTNRHFAVTSCHFSSLYRFHSLRSLPFPLCIFLSATGSKMGNCQHWL